jgi:hypothetical protein
MGERGHEAYALALLGAIEQQADAQEQALAIALELGMLPLAAQTHLDLGQRLDASGEAAQAQTHLTRGQQLMKRMSMQPWYDRSQIEERGNGHLYIVARSNPQLYEFLAHEFTGDRGIKVVLDRREHAQWQMSRHEERRLHPVDDDLRAWELALAWVRDA